MFDVSKLLTKFLEGIWKILEKLQQELCNGVPVQQITGMKTQLSKLFKLRNIHEMSSVEFFFYRNTTISGSLQNSCSKCCNSSICQLLLFFRLFAYLSSSYFIKILLQNSPLIFYMPYFKYARKFNSRNSLSYV